MEYIVSHNFDLPESSMQMAKNPWFSLWRIRLWPYREPVVSDIVYWYETPRKRIVWKSRISDVVRFPYDDKEVVRRLLGSKYGKIESDNPYFTRAPERGYCLAWKITPMQRLNLHKPESLRFPHQGWLRVDEAIAKNWLRQPSLVDDGALDEMIPKGPLIERLRELNVKMRGVSPERIRSLVSQTVRRDTQLVRTLKKLCGFRCQFPGCETRIPMRGGGFYIEVAHIQPVRSDGRSMLGNLLVLCPNHHKEFDYGDLKVIEQKVELIRGKLNGRNFEIHLP